MSVPNGTGDRMILAMMPRESSWGVCNDGHRKSLLSFEQGGAHGPSEGACSAGRRSEGRRAHQLLVAQGRQARSEISAVRCRKAWRPDGKEDRANREEAWRETAETARCPTDPPGRRNKASPRRSCFSMRSEIDRRDFRLDPETKRKVDGIEPPVACRWCHGRGSDRSGVPKSRAQSMIMKHFRAVCPWTNKPEI